MEGDQGKVIQRSLRSTQGCFQNLGGTLDNLDQVVVHGAGHIKDKCQGGCALRDVLLWNSGPCVLPSGECHWQRKRQPYKSGAHFRSKSLLKQSFWILCSRQSEPQGESWYIGRDIGLSKLTKTYFKMSTNCTTLAPPEEFACWCCCCFHAPLWFLLQFRCAGVAAFHLSFSSLSGVSAAQCLFSCVRDLQSGALVQLCHTKTTSQLARKSQRRKLPHAEKRVSDWLRVFGMTSRDPHA